jgi:hypothetical protein
VDDVVEPRDRVVEVQCLAPGLEGHRQHHAQVVHARQEREAHQPRGRTRQAEEHRAAHVPGRREDHGAEDEQVAQEVDRVAQPGVQVSEEQAACAHAMRLPGSP